MKTYSTIEVELILEWVQRYFKISALIDNAFSDNNLRSCCCAPSIENEIEYQHQRLWFLKNHNKFVPIWKDFCLSNGITIDFSGDIDKIGYIEDPFFYYYPDNLYGVADMLGAAGSADGGYWDKQKQDLVLCSNRKFSQTAIHLAHWIGEFAENAN